LFAALFSAVSDVLNSCAVVFIGLASLTVCTLPELPKKNNAPEVKKKWTAGELRFGRNLLEILEIGK
jgi:hypothetical protein